MLVINENFIPKTLDSIKQIDTIEEKNAIVLKEEKIFVANDDLEKMPDMYTIKDLLKHDLKLLISYLDSCDTPKNKVLAEEAKSFVDLLKSSNLKFLISCKKIIMDFKLSIFNNNSESKENTLNSTLKEENSLKFSDKSIVKETKETKKTKETKTIDKTG